MESNEIITNNEVIDATEEIAKSSSGKAFKVAAGIGLTILVGGLAYHYIVKPVMVEIKARKEMREMVVSEDETHENDLQEE